MRLYSVLWCALFFAALAATGTAATRAAWSGPIIIPTLTLGFNYEPADDGRVFLSEIVGDQARAAGLTDGTELLAIDADPELDDALPALSEAAYGTNVAITVRRSGQSDRQVTLTTSREHVAAAANQAGYRLAVLDLLSIAIIVIPTLLILAASLVLFVRQRQNPVAALLALLPLTVAATPLELVPLDLYNWMIAANQAILPIALLAFPDGRFTTRISRALLALSVVIIGSLFVTQDVIDMAGYPLLAMCALAVVWRVRRSRSSVERHQLRWALIGFSLAAVAALVAFAATQAMPLRGDIAYLTTAMLLVDIFDALFYLSLYGGLLIGLTRYRLYDADVVLTRSLVWIVAAPVLALVFGITTEFIKGAFSSLLSSDTMAVTIAGVLTAMLIGPIEKRLTKLVEAWSRRKLIALEADMPAAVRDLRESDDHASLTHYVCRQVQDALDATSVVLLVGAEVGDEWQIAAMSGAPMESENGSMTFGHLPSAALVPQVDRSDVLFPFRVPLTARPKDQMETLGWLLIGSRPDGSIQDRPARGTIAQLAPAIGHALLVIAARQKRRASDTGTCLPSDGTNHPQGEVERIATD